MIKKVLITGGAGFIGSHLADELLKHNYEVVVLDNLDPQVHGTERKRPDYLHDDVQLIVGDVRDKDKVKEALSGVDAVFHFAAKVGVGQSMYEIHNYTDVNNVGTAVLLEELVNNPVKKLIVASSMSIYGEGLYKDTDGKIYENVQRHTEQLKNSEWELYEASEKLKPVPTPEEKQPSLASVYALSKYDQEKLCLILGQAYDMPTIALRFFNVYGSRQALSNPYTGVLAIFASRYLNDNAPLIFEDGFQKRDFVHVRDVAKACRLAMENNEIRYDLFNVGSGKAYTIKEIADYMAIWIEKTHINPQVTGKYRAGDIRHCFADIRKIENSLGFRPEITLEEGLKEITRWLKGQIADDQVDKASAELEKRGLAI